ncbi:MAG: hypothetical protein WC683_08170 [bacterium]
MAEGRRIDSNIFADEWYGQLDFFDQQVWIGLFARCADDQGRLLDNPALIRAALFPYKDIPCSDIERVLAGFATDAKIVRYAKEGKRLVQLRNWWEHQPLQWARPSKWAAPDNWTDRVRATIKGVYQESNWKPQVDSPGGEATLPPTVDAPNLNLNLNLTETTTALARENENRITGASENTGPLFAAIEHAGVLLNPRLAEQWGELADTFGMALVMAALDEAVASKAGASLPYVKKVCENCKREGRMPGKRNGPLPAAEKPPPKASEPIVGWETDVFTGKRERVVISNGTSSSGSP